MIYSTTSSETAAQSRAAIPAKRSRAWSLPSIGVLDAIAFLAPLLRFVQIDVLGRLYLTDLLLAGLLLYLLIRSGRRLSARLPRTAILLLVVWLLAQVATDLIRGSAFHDYARGWSMIGFALINFCALYLLVAGKPKRLVLFAAGAALGQIAGYFIAPSEYGLGNAWKFGYGTGVSWLLVLLAIGLARGRRLSRMRPAAVLLLVALLNIFMGFRSTGGIAFLTACYLALQAVRGTRSTATQIRPRQLFVLGAVAALGAWGVMQLYEYSVEGGLLGAEARQKYEMQTAGEYGLLLGGRSEFLVSSLAVLESPVIGHGSWAKDCRYASLYVELKREAGYIPGAESETCLIPAHSHFMGAWVQAGVLGAVFWLWVLTLPVRTLARLYATRERLTPLVAFLAFLLLWDIFFSPFAGDRRFMTPFYIVLMMGYLPAGTKRRLVTPGAPVQLAANPLSEVYR